MCCIGLKTCLPWRCLYLSSCVIQLLLNSSLLWFINFNLSFQTSSLPIPFTIPTYPCLPPAFSAPPSPSSSLKRKMEPKYIKIRQRGVFKWSPGKCCRRVFTFAASGGVEKCMKERQRVVWAPPLSFHPSVKLPHPQSLWGVFGTELYLCFF